MYGKNMLIKQNYTLLLLVILMLTGCEGAAEREVLYMEKAQAYSDEGNYDKMNVELKNVLQINPKNIEARYLLALDAERKQEWRKMFSQLSFVVKENPNHIKAQIGLGKLFLLSAEIDKTNEIIDTVLKISPNNADALTLKAAIALKEDKKDQAMVLLDQAMENSPGHYDASLLQINILASKKKLTEALQVANQGLISNPDKLSLALVKIKILKVLGENQQVEELYKQLIPQHPKKKKLYFNLAKIYLLDKKIDQAETLLIESVKQIPDDSQPKIVLFDFLLAQKGVEQAEKQANQLIQENPENFGFRFAKLMFFKQQPEKIEQELQQIVIDDQLGLAGIKARNSLIKILYAKGEKEQANILIAEILEIDPRNSGALLSRSRFAVVEKKYEAAIADARTVLKSNPDSEDALMIKANAEIQLREIELAQVTLERILEVNPQNIAAVKDLARVKISQNNIVGSIKILENARHNFKDDKQVQVMLIDLYGKSKSWEKAEVIATALLDDPKFKEIGHYKLAQLYVGQDKFKQASQEFLKILEIKPLAMNAIKGAVNSYLALGQLKDAEKLLDSKILVNKENPILLTLRANLYLHQQQGKKAEQIFKKIVILKPKIDTSYSNLASFYLQSKQLDKAIVSYKQGLLVIPDSKKILMQLGVLNTIKGDSKHAIEAYEKLLELEPNNLLVVNNLSALLSDSEDTKLVEKALTIVQTLKGSESPFFLDTYGWVLFRNKQINEAVDILEMAVLKKSGVPEMHYHLGMAYLAADRKLEARSQLEKAVVETARFKDLEIAKAELKKLL